MNTKPVTELQPGERYDAQPLLAWLEETDADVVRCAAENQYFEVECVERFDDTRVIVFGHPFNMLAGTEMNVEVV